MSIAESMPELTEALVLRNCITPGYYSIVEVLMNSSSAIKSAVVICLNLLSDKGNLVHLFLYVKYSDWRTPVRNIYMDLI